MTTDPGMELDYTIKQRPSMKLVGAGRDFSMRNAYAEIPKFWDEARIKYADSGIGEYAVCIDGNGDTFRYLIAGKYVGGEVPVGMELCEFSAGEFAVFDCVGPLPERLQDLNDRVFHEWLPGNGRYKLRGNATIEQYDPTNEDTSDPHYHSAIIIPVERR